MDVSILKDKIILIAEDDANSSLLLNEFLSETGAKLCFTETGFEVVELAKKMKVDIILMDYKLPGIDGHTASEQIKEFSDVPIIAQTASILSPDVKGKLTEFFDAYILKPYGQADLLELICKQLTKDK